MMKNKMVQILLEQNLPTALRQLDLTITQITKENLKRYCIEL